MPGKHTHEREVLDHLVATAVRSDGDAGVRRRDLHVEVGVADGVADLVVGATGGEHRERAGERDLARHRESGRDVHHVGLGDTDVEEALLVLLGELEGGGRLGEVGLDGDDIHALVGQLDQCLAQCFPRCLVAHEPLPSVSGASSSTACATCSAEGALPCQPASPSMNDTPLPFTVCATMTAGPPVYALAAISAS